MKSFFGEQKWGWYMIMSTGICKQSAIAASGQQLIDGPDGRTTYNNNMVKVHVLSH